MSNYVEESSFELPPAGTVAAVCAAWVDLGTHRNRFFGLDVKPGQPEAREYHRKLMIVFELAPAEGDEAPFLIAEVWTRTLAKNSSMARHCASWGLKPENGRLNFDRMLGRPAMLNIAHKRTGQGRDFAIVQAVTEWPRGQPAPKPQHPPFSWDIDAAKELPTADWLPYALGKPVHEMIRESLEWKARHSPTSNGAPTDRTPDMSRSAPF
jgi:hypothetical protein